MRTAYDALKRAVIKDFGKWWSFEWKAINGVMKSRLYTEPLAEKYWEDNFFPMISDMWIHTGPSGELRICGKLSGGWYDEKEENIKRLQEVKTNGRYWVFCSYSCDDNFVLYGFRTKQEALMLWKSEKKRIDEIFYTFWYRW